MQDGPLVEKCTIAIQFLGTYVIVMDVAKGLITYIHDGKVYRLASNDSNI